MKVKLVSGGQLKIEESSKIYWSFLYVQSYINLYNKFIAHFIFIKFQIKIHINYYILNKFYFLLKLTI